LGKEIEGDFALSSLDLLRSYEITKKSEEESTQNGVGIFYTFWQYTLTDDDLITIPSADIPNNHS
jgi:hypothetical protein